MSVIPYVIEQTGQGERSYDIFSRLLKDRMGLAASFGAFLLAGGTKGKRMALPNAEIMIHQPAIHGNGIQGPASDIRIMSDYMQKNKRRLNQILADNAGKSTGQIERDTERDNYMTAQEAVDYGLID